MAGGREQDIEHLFRRAGFGASRQEIADFTRLGFAGFSTAAAHLLNYSRLADDVDAFIGTPGYAGVTAPGGHADSAAVAELLSSYRQVEAAGFATPAQAHAAQFGRPDRRLALLRADGSPLLNLVFDSTATGFWARAAGDSTVYRLDTWSVDRLLPSDSTLKAKAS
jgi:hypothetical protein